MPVPTTTQRTRSTEVFVASLILLVATLLMLAQKGALVQREDQQQSVGLWASATIRLNVAASFRRARKFEHHAIGLHVVTREAVVGAPQVEPELSIVRAAPSTLDRLARC